MISVWLTPFLQLGTSNTFERKAARITAGINGVIIALAGLTLSIFEAISI